MLNFETAKELLAKYGQSHILEYYHELSEEEQKNLLSQIKLIDFSVLESLKDKGNEHAERGKFVPLGATTIEEIAKKKQEFTDAGIEAIKAGKAAAVLLAGGQGTRLGFDKPKGMFNMGINHEIYIFQCLINNLMDVVKQADAWIPLYIMTSEKNNKDTIEFFKEKDFFGYNSDFVRFFIQDMAPSTDFNGKVYMESKSTISLSPNGNGGWFSSMVRAGLLSELKDRGIEWLNVFAVDNVLQRIADPAFLGAVILSGSESGGKVVSKAEPEERVGVLCLEDGRPSIVEYYEMTDDMRTMREDDGRLSYNYGVILNYLFSLKKLESIVNEQMPIHVVEKKIPYMTDNGEFVKPDTANGYKFETLVLDMVHKQDSCLSYEVVRNNEFAPVKNPTGIDSVESARALLIENGVKL
ncbi:MAG: UDPGP type 1 family protein [Clostridiales bacterium]|nr:UDPGP type 1 family protein [Clostridiales bacterium]